MQRLLAGAAIALSAFSGQAMAADASMGAMYVPPPYQAPPSCQTSGVVSVYGIWGQSYDYYESGGYGLGASGKANTCLDTLGLQMDAFGEAVSATEGDFEDYNSGQAGGAFHLYKRDPSSHAIGVVVGATHLFDSYEYYNPGFLGFLGVDAHLYMGNFTVAGQAVYFQSFGQDSSSASPEHGYTVSAEGRWFVSSNTKLTGILGYHSDHDPYADYTASGLFFGVGAEHQFAGTPVSIFANVTRYQNQIEGDDLPTTVAKFGLAMHINQPDLITEDRNGASFSTPMIDTWTNLANAYYR